MAAPGFLNLRLAPAWLEAALDAASRPARRSGACARRSPGTSTSSSCRPTRPGRCTSATRGGRSWATSSAGCSRRPATRSRASTTSTISGPRSATSAPPCCALREGEPRARGRLPRRLRGATSRRRCPATSGRGHGAGRRRGGRARTLGLGAGAGGHRGVAGPPWRPLRRLEERGLALRATAGSAGPSSGCRPPARSTSRMARCGSAPPQFGDDKDRVVRRSNGEFTYFGSDIGYVVDKFERGFDQLLYLWGQDHHGTVARLRNAAQAMGLPRGRCECCSSPGSASCATGARSRCPSAPASSSPSTSCWARSASMPRAGSSPPAAHTVGIDFDIELAKKQSAENPVYYVQYAHARIASILRKAAEAGLTPAASLAGALEGDPMALGLAGSVLRLPEVRRGRRGRRGDAGPADLCDRAGDHLPRLLPRPAGRRSGRPGDLGGAPGARRRDAPGARQRPRPARDLRPRVDVDRAQATAARARQRGSRSRSGRPWPWRPRPGARGRRWSPAPPRRTSQPSWRCRRWLCMTRYQRPAGTLQIGRAVPAPAAHRSRRVRADAHASATARG